MHSRSNTPLYALVQVRASLYFTIIGFSSELATTMKQWLTLDLPATPLFAHIPERLSVAERIELSHERAKVIALRYGTSQKRPCTKESR